MEYASREVIIFRDRHHAGKMLAQRLLLLKEEGGLDLKDAVVIALPRGGLPVAYEVAMALNLPLDVFVVRKIGVPYQQELAAGAVAEGGELVVNESVARSAGLSHNQMLSLAENKKKEIDARINKFRQGRPAKSVKDKTVILIDDGLATGASALSAIHLLRKMNARRIVLALPVCPADAVSRISPEVDDFVVLEKPSSFWAVGQWYSDFTQVTDDQVVQYLRKAGQENE